MSKTYEHKTINSKPSEIYTVCRSFLGNSLKERGFKITGLYMCRYGASCKEAHQWNQLKLKKYINDWDTMLDKSSINLYTIYRNIIDTITQSRDNIKNSKYASQISKLESMNFVELLQFCYDLICYHRRIAKDLPSRKMKGSVVPDLGEGGYRYKEEVPQFYLENEDTFWALERTLHSCSMYENMMTHRDCVYATSHICTGDINCKLGEHNPSKIACNDDILYGKCSCISSSKIIEEKKYIESELLELKKQLESSVDSDGFQVKLSKKVHTEITTKIAQLQELYMKIPSRKIHYTEQGMKPMSVHLAAVAVVKAKEVDISKLEITAVKKLVKKSYD